MTAEFIVKQTGEQLVSRLDDLFLMFDTFQESLYSNDPAINQRSESASSEHKSESNKSQSAVDRLLNKGSTKSDSKDKQKWEAGNNNNKVMYEESILMTLLGPDYMQFISEETGEWINEELVVEKF